MSERVVDNPMRILHFFVQHAHRYRITLRVLALLVTMLAVSLPSSTYAQNQSGITAPAAGAPVTGDVAIIGTAVIEPFRSYELYYKLEPSGDDAYIYFGGGTNQVINGQLGIWSTGDLAPGTYSLRLRVVKTDSNYDEKFAYNLVVNQQPPTPSATPTSSEPTPTSIPTATYTPAPPASASIGQVGQPEVEDGLVLPTNTPAAVAGAVDAGAVAAPPAADAGAAEAPLTVIDGNAANTTIDDTATSSLGRDLGEALSIDRMRTRFFSGVRISAALFLAAFAIFAGKRIFDWAWTRYR